MKQLFLAGLILFLFVSITKCEPWEEIIPLISNREDVDRKLGLCKDGHLWICTYRTIDSTVIVSYYIANECDNGGLYDVKSGTVMSISVLPMNHRRFDQTALLGFDFTKEIDNELPGIFHLRDKNRGFSISIDKERIREYNYYPSKEDKSKRACAKTNKRSSV